MKLDRQLITRTVWIVSNEQLLSWVQNPVPLSQLDSFDGLQLATALDDIVDNAEQTADMLGLYAVEATMEHACLLAEVLVAAGEQVSDALRALRAGSELGPHLVEIHRLENLGDSVSREAIAQLFDGSFEVLEVVKLKDLYALLETALDRCEDVANVIESITIKNA